MVSIFGLTKQDNLRAFMEVCFNPATNEIFYATLDEAITRDDLSGEQYRLLPLLYCRSDISKFSEATRSKIASAYKHTLYRNHMMLERAHRFQTTLADAGFVPPIFMKGLPYVLRTQDGVGSRPMADVDLLIPQLFLRAQDFSDLLSLHQFKEVGSGLRSMTTVSPEGFEFDIHWYLSEWALSQDLVNSLVFHSNQIQFRGVSYHVPCVEHQLVHTLGHGVLNPPLACDARWSIDVLAMLTEYKNFDVEKTIEFANKFEARSKLKDGFMALYQQTPEGIGIDHLMLRNIANNIVSDNKIVRWVFNFKINPGVKKSKVPIRSLWFRHMVTCYLYSPFVLRFKNGLALSKSVRLSQSFKPVSLVFVMKSLAIKVARRLPFLVCNVWIPNRTKTGSQ